MRGAAAAIIRGVAQLIYPNLCLVCEASEAEATPFRHGLCMSCEAAIASDPFEACPWCAQTIGPHTDTTHGCADCRGTALGFERAFRLGLYAGPLRDAVLRLKLLGGEGLADRLGLLFAEHRGSELRAAGIDLVVPVPLHWWRKWVRGYNQSEAVARELASGLGVAFAPNLLARIRWTPQQVQPTRAARRENVRGAFRVRSRARVVGRGVLLVDDVMTTGSTLGEAARVLLDAGAARVVVAVLARK
jgi:ComF family protein